VKLQDLLWAETLTALKMESNSGKHQHVNLVFFCGKGVFGADDFVINTVSRGVDGANLYIPC